MFKKKRNALLEEMREIAENETVRVLESMGLVEMKLFVSGPFGSSTKYSATPTTDRAARALAEEAKTAAEEALEAAGVARADAAMALERETAEAYRAAKEAEAEVGAAAATVARNESPCGCRCNNANGTRPTGSVIGGGPLVFFGASRLPRKPLLDERILVCSEHLLGRSLSTDVSKLCGERRLCGNSHKGDGRSTIWVCSNEWDGFADRFAAMRERVDAPLDSHVESEDRVSVSSDSGAVDHEVARHCSSPVVAESEAGTSDAPAMTVQEGGSSDAAPGVEGPFSPVSSTPRFVAVGEYVYDRDLHRFATSPSPAYRARLLNEGSFHPDIYTWEDAK